MENSPANPHEPKQELDDPLVTANINTTSDDSLNDLCNNMNQCLKIEDVKENNNEIKNKILGEEQNLEDYDEEEEEEEEEDLTEALLVQMGYWKPEPKKPPAPLPRLASPDAGIKLVSAMKGSREKEGMQVEERRVSWAPDVYDPVPKSPEHFWTSRTVRQRSESKKSVKNKQKWSGKATGGGGGGGGKGGKEKDKKQVKKYGGSASKCFDSLDDDETLVDGGDRYAGYDKYY